MSAQKMLNNNGFAQCRTGARRCVQQGILRWDSTVDVAEPIEVCMRFRENTGEKMPKA